MLALALVSCSKNTKEDTSSNEIKEEVNTETIKNENTSDSNKEETTSNSNKSSSPITNTDNTNTSSKSYLGTWVVSKKIATTPVYAMSEDKIKSYIGKELYLTEKKVSFDKENLVNPTFEETTLSDSDFISENKVSLKTIGISLPSVKKVDVIQNVNSNWTSFFGNTFYVKDNNTLITLWDGVFFELNKK
jgi:hypothetical protein